MGRAGREGEGRERQNRVARLEACVVLGRGREGAVAECQQRVFDPTPQVKSQSSLEEDMSGRKVLAIADAREESMRPSDCD